MTVEAQTMYRSLVKNLLNFFLFNLSTILKPEIYLLLNEEFWMKWERSVYPVSSWSGWFQWKPSQETNISAFAHVV